MKDFAEEIEAYALQNALEFGKADASKILPKLFQHGLKKEDIKETMALIHMIVKRVNSSSKKERERLFEQFKDLVKKREEKSGELPELPNVSGKVVMRLAPFPSGALHIGNAKTYLLNALYAEKYKAKLILVMDDTIGSEEKQIDKESYKLIEEGFKLLGVEYSKPIIYKSDRLKLYYDYAEKLIEKGKAYVCHCSQETLRKNRADGVVCGCRQFPPDIQMLRWKDMFSAGEGEAILRIKTDMLHPNPAFRDRVLFKISDRKHPRVGNKYRIWPSLEMSWAIDDHDLGITHIIRGNDLMIESDMEKFIWDIFGWKHSETIHTGLIRLSDVKISKSKSQQEVRSGVYSGWDDPRTYSIQSLVRRGIRKEAIRAFVKEIGLNKQDITTPIDTLYAINRRMIDLESDRYSFVENPVELKIKNAPELQDVGVPIHPDKKEVRIIKLNKIFISKKDFDSHKRKEVRLLHLYNVMLKDSPVFTSEENKNIGKINWVSEHVPVRVLMPDGKWVEGFAEEAAGKLKKGTVVQFERFGFARYDEKKNKYFEFWFAHR